VVGGNDGAAAGARCHGDLEIVRAAESACTADVREQGRMVASDGQVVRDDLDALKDPFEEGLTLGVCRRSANSTPTSNSAAVTAATATSSSSWSGSWLGQRVPGR
jgi:hypothetical protein